MEVNCVLAVLIGTVCLFAIYAPRGPKSVHDVFATEFHLHLHESVSHLSVCRGGGSLLVM